MSSAAAAAAQIRALIEAMKANRTVNYAAIGMTALISADYLHTLPREVQLMWPTKLSVPKVLFFLVRYYTFVHSMISAWHHGDMSLTGDSDCYQPFAIDAYSCLVTHALCEAISYIRAYAFSGRNRYVLGFLVILFVTIHSVEFYILAKFVKTVRFATLPPEIQTGCVAIRGDNKALSLIFELILASLATVTILMIGTAWWRRRQSHGAEAGSLLKLFYRDGIFYFIFLSTLAVANIIFDHTAPSNGLQFTMVQIQVHLNGVAAGRLLLHLREWAAKGVAPSGLNSYGSGYSAPVVLRGKPVADTTLGDLELSSQYQTYPRAPRVFIEVSKNTSQGF